jgi:hypothetical protein
MSGFELPVVDFLGREGPMPFEISKPAVGACLGTNAAAGAAGHQRRLLTMRRRTSARCVQALPLHV